MALRKRDTSAGFRPDIKIGESAGLPANRCIRIDGQLDASLLSPTLHQVLLGLARLRNVVSSLRIEGESIQLAEARRVLDSQRSQTPVEKGVLQLSGAYADLARGRLPELSINGMRAAHRRLFDGVLDEAGVGKLKATQNVLIESMTGLEKFVPTPPERTEAELVALLDWLADQGFQYPSPVVAAVFFAEFQAIHPFENGNGRMGRYLNLAILYRLGLRNAPLVPLDTRFFRTHARYYEMLGTTNRGRDFHHWIRYYVKELEAAYRLAASRADLGPVVEGFSRESTRSLLRWVLTGDGGWFTHGDYPNAKGYSPPAISSSLNELWKADVLEAEGERRGRRYRLHSKFLAGIYGRRL